MKMNDVKMARTNKKINRKQMMVNIIHEKESLKKHHNNVVCIIFLSLIGFQAVQSQTNL